MTEEQAQVQEPVAEQPKPVQDKDRIKRQSQRIKDGLVKLKP